MEAKKWRFNNETKSVEIVIDDEGTEKILAIAQEEFMRVISTLPEFDEEKMLCDLLNQLYKLKEQKMIAISKIDEECKKLRDIHADIRKDLKTADKIQILRLSAASKDLANEKVVLDEERQLVKMLTVEESRMRARIAELRVGKNQ